MSQFTSVAIAVVQYQDRFLVGRRSEHLPLGGLWEFPGGKVEPGEELAEGLKREIREELGVEIEVGQPFGVYRHGYTHFKVTLHAFVCRIAAGEPQALEASEIAWAVPEELAGYPMGKIDRQIARRIMTTDFPADSTD